jgi:hypothetical protein
MSVFLITAPLGTRGIGGAFETVSVHLAVHEELIIAHCAKESICFFWRIRKIVKSDR